MAADLPGLEFARAMFHAGCNTTVRRGRRWHGVAAARLRLADGRLSAPVTLTTQLRVFSGLDAQALRFEHDPDCRTPAGLLLRLQQHYPGFAADEIVTVCHFHL